MSFAEKLKQVVKNAKEETREEHFANYDKYKADIKDILLDHAKQGHSSILLTDLMISMRRSCPIPIDKLLLTQWLKEELGLTFLNKDEISWN